MPALAELEQAWDAAREDPSLQGGARTACCATRAVARRRCTKREGCRKKAGPGESYLEREDLNHTGSHKLNNALGQALLARRMGKRRGHRRDRRRTTRRGEATVSALLGLECVIYMGTEDTRRQRPNVQRMELLGASVQAVDAGARTLKEATSAAIRDWVTNVESTHYVIGSAVGPAPYPGLVRDLQRVIGDEARAQILRIARGGLPERVIACVGWRAQTRSARSRRSWTTEQVQLVGVEAGGDGMRHAQTWSPADGRRARGHPARVALGGDAGRGGADRRGALDIRGA